MALALPSKVFVGFSRPGTNADDAKRTEIALADPAGRIVLGTAFGLSVHLSPPAWTGPKTSSKASIKQAKVVEAAFFSHADDFGVWITQ